MPNLIDIGRPLGIAALLAVTGCATAPERGPDLSTVTVEVQLPPEAAYPLSPGHTLDVIAEEVSVADAAADVLSGDTESLDGRAPPWRMTLGFPTEEVDPRRTYAVRATIRDAEGRLVFVTDERHAVLTHGAGRTATITLHGPLQPR